MDFYKARELLSKGKNIFDIPMRVVFYARVSTDKYEQANSLKNQVDYYENLIKQNENWDYCGGYIDNGISGTSVEKREQFLKMISDAREGKFDFVITKEISRFSRNILDSIQYSRLLTSYGVGILYQSDNINTLNTDAELRLTMLGIIAQEEVRKISERVKFGCKRAIENGIVLGNSSIWGYTKKDGKLIIDKKQAEIVKKIFQYYCLGNIGIRALSNKLAEEGIFTEEGNQISASTIKGIIQNPKYMGYYCANKSYQNDCFDKKRLSIEKENWVVYKNKESVPAIVDEKTWRLANQIYQNRSKRVVNKKSCANSYTYSSMIFCAQHHTKYYHRKYRSKEVWQCKRYVENGIKGCENAKIYTYEFDEIVKRLCSLNEKDKQEIESKMIGMYHILSKKLKNKMQDIECFIQEQLQLDDIFDQEFIKSSIEKFVVGKTGDIVSIDVYFLGNIQTFIIDIKNNRKIQKASQ